MRGMHIRGIGVLIIILLVSSNLSALANRRSQSVQQPNIILIVTDDQTYEANLHLPYVQSRSDWYRFQRAYVNVSLCCPSRATLLTGQYSHHTGVEYNEATSNFQDHRTLATWLRTVGYRTALIGKYLNKYPWDKGVTYIPPGWDHWEVFSNLFFRKGYYNSILRTFFERKG